MMRIASGVSTEEGETALLGESGVVNSGGGVQLSVVDADPDQKSVAV